MSGAGTPDPGDVRDEIAQTRAELGDTVQELAARTDVTARAKHAAGSIARRPASLVAFGVGATLIGLAIYLLRRRRS